MPMQEKVDAVVSRIEELNEALHPAISLMLTVVAVDPEGAQRLLTSAGFDTTPYSVKYKGQLLERAIVQILTFNANKSEVRGRTRLLVLSENRPEMENAETVYSLRLGLMTVSNLLDIPVDDLYIYEDSAAPAGTQGEQV